MKKSILAFFCFIHLFSFTQDLDDTEEFLDSKYLEDQFYAGLAYNGLLNRPEGVIQRNLSYNLQLGFIKDIPVNEKRNFGFALGVGYATNSYYTNIQAASTDGGITYDIPTVSFDRSKLGTHAIEFPLEIRWRTSNAIDYKFWRIYAGGKINYNFARTSKFVDEIGSDSFSNEDIRQWNYGLMLNFGYNTFNIHLYYELNPILKDGVVFNSQENNMNVFRVGLIFYIL